MMSLGPTIETDRLLLRPPSAEDFDSFCAFFADPEATRFIGGVQSPSVVWRSIRTMAGAWALDGFHFFSVIEKRSGDWIGRVGPIYPLGWPGPEVGWSLISSHWRKGYAREAATASMDFAFSKLGWDRVIHTITPGNERSAKLATLLGSRKTGQGVLPEPFSHLPVEIWEQSRKQWQSRRGFSGSA